MQCLLRCYLVGACFNTRGLQNVGFAFAMEPGLRAIHADPKALAAARKRYARHFNSHPFWAPLLVGIFLSIETRISRGEFPPALLDKVKNTTSYTLSAIGDSVFAGSLLIFWALTSACLLVAGRPAPALLLGAAMFLGLQAFKALTFLGGLRMGLGVLERLKRWDLINWGQRIKHLNAVLMLALWHLLWPKPLAWQSWLLGAAGLSAVGWLVSRRLMTRGGLAAALLAAWLAWPWLADFWRQWVG